MNYFKNVGKCFYLKRFEVFILVFILVRLKNTHKSMN